MTKLIRFSYMLKLYMSVNEVTCRTLGKEIGVSATTVSRIASGEAMDAKTLLLVMNWLMHEEV